MRDYSHKTQCWRPAKPRSLPSEVINIVLAVVNANISIILADSYTKPFDTSEFKKQIASYALVCHHWYRILSPYLYKTITLHSKGDMDILYARIEKPRGLVTGADITSLALIEADNDVWAYGAAALLASRLPHLFMLHQERNFEQFSWDVIQSRTPPRISTALPALYSAYKMVTTFSLAVHHFRSFAALTQLVNALPVLETFRCARVTWDKCPDNPRLLRAPRRLSRIEVFGVKVDGVSLGQLIQLFTARCGAWKPTARYPELGCNDSKLVRTLMEDIPSMSAHTGSSECVIECATIAETDKCAFCFVLVNITR